MRGKYSLNRRTGCSRRMAFLFLGLGSRVFSYEDIIAENPYHHIAKINFKWFSGDVTSSDRYRDMKYMLCKVTGKKIRIQFSKEELIPILDGMLFRTCVSELK